MIFASVLALLTSLADVDSAPTLMPARDFSGQWKGISESPEEDLSGRVVVLSIAMDGPIIHGTYCDATIGGQYISCTEAGDNVQGRVTPGGNEAKLTFSTRDSHEVYGIIRALENDKMELRLTSDSADLPRSVRELRRFRTIPKERGACVLTAAVKAHFYDAPRIDRRTKSYVLREEAVLARGWSTDQKFLLVTYSGAKTKHKMAWVQCRDFDACRPGTSSYRRLPEPMCAASLSMAE